MKLIPTLFSVALLLAGAAHAEILSPKLGESISGRWYMCKNVETPLAVLAAEGKDGYEASYKIFKADPTCTKLPTPVDFMPLERIAEGSTTASSDYIIVIWKGTINGETVWVINAEAKPQQS